MSTTQTIRLPRAVSTGSASFQSSHYPHPLERAQSRLNLSLRCLPASICRSVLRFHGPHRCPALPLASSRKLSHSGNRFVVPWICRVDRVAFSWLIAQTIFIVAASERSGFCVVFPQWSRNGFLPRSRRRFSSWVIRACSGSVDWSLRLTSLIVQTCRTNNNVEIVARWLLSPNPLLSFVMSMSLLICLHFVSLPPPHLSTFRIPPPASVLLSAFSFPVAISFSVSRLPSHVGYCSHDILACFIS